MIDPTRRTILTVSTLAVGAACVAAGLRGLGRAMAPTADVVAESRGTRVPLASVPTGEQRIVVAGEKPVLLRALSDAQVRQLRSEGDIHLPDPFSRNANLPEGRPADFQARSLTADRVYVVLWGLCPRLGCIPMVGVGDHGGWFCPCGGAHYDLLGRIRKGPSPWNMLIPAYELGADNVLTVYPYGRPGAPTI